MRSLHSDIERRVLNERVRRLTPDTVPRWGKMNAAQMVAHLTNAMRMATGELPVRGKRHPARLFPLKQLLIYVLPLPKNLPTATELIDRAPEPFTGEIEAFRAAVEDFGSRPRNFAWPDHPLFGAMSRRDWGALAYRHCDHHLRQFGV
ncbi:MAG: DUF1569 domain-containing protein [Gemmatimonadota bacterium]|nr:DUF1569 domain-containing protein [Gemmatimonadota bacterium]